MLKANNKVKVHIYSGRNEIKTRHYDTVFAVYEKDGKLGIDWNTENSPYMNGGDTFSPLDTFAQSVVFENIETGARYHFDNLTNTIQEV